MPLAVRHQRIPAAPSTALTNYRHLGRREAPQLSNPDVQSCVQGVKRHQEAGADQLILLMQTDQIRHEKVMGSIERFGTQVAPKFN